MGGVKPASEEVVQDEALIMEKDPQENIAEDFPTAKTEVDLKNKPDWRRGSYPNRWTIPSSIL